jgi:tetratricopeptide (TPR) repeat protein
MALLQPARRLHYGLVVIVSMAATLLTLSRGAWLGMAAGQIAALVLAWRAGAVRAIPARARWIAAAAVPAALAGVTIAAVLWWGNVFRERLAESLASGGVGGRARLEIWRTAIGAWSTRPLLGHGPDTFSLLFPRYQTAAYWRYEWSGLPLHAHSIYFQTLATRGALGVAAAIGCLAALAAAARSAWRAGEDARRLVAALAAALCALGVSGGFGSIGMGGTLWGMLMVAGVATLTSVPAAGAREGPASLRPLFLGGLIALLAAGWASADLRSSFLDRRGQDLMQISTLASGEQAREARRAASSAYAGAAALMPFEDALVRRRADSLRFLAALEKDTMGVLEDAERQARRAVAMAPLRSLNQRYLGLILLSEASLRRPDRIPEGEAVYARSLELAPMDALVMLELANAELELGRPRMALEPARRAAELYPDLAEPLSVLARVHWALGEVGPARATLARALAADWRGDEKARREAERMLHELGAPRP